LNTNWALFPSYTCTIGCVKYPVVNYNSRCIQSFWRVFRYHPVSSIC